jgi:hypothetical protein
MADIVICPHCLTRVLPAGPQGVTCPSCARDTSTAATASDRLRVAQRKKLAPRPSMVSVLVGSMIGEAIAVGFYVIYVLIFPSTYDHLGGDVARLSSDLGWLLVIYAIMAVVWTINATAFLNRWRFSVPLYLVSTPLWLLAPTGLMVLGGHAFTDENVRSLLGMNFYGIPLTPMLLLVYFYFAWVLTRPATSQWLRGDAAPDAVTPAAKVPA